METLTGVEFRWLDGDAVNEVAPLIEAHGWVPLNPSMSRVRAAYDNNGILIGFLPFNCVPHIDGLWVDLRHRGAGVAEQLVKDVVAFLYEVECPAAFVICDNPASEKLAQAYGMELVTQPVYRKVV